VPCISNMNLTKFRTHYCILTKAVPLPNLAQMLLRVPSTCWLIYSNILLLVFTIHFKITFILEFKYMYIHTYIHTYIYSCVRKKSFKCNAINLCETGLKLYVEVKRLTEHSTVSADIFSFLFFQGCLNTLEQLQKL
jgi:hypothetical protein